MGEASSGGILESIGRRIEAGEFDDGSFHRFVQSEIYPLLTSGELSEDEFTQLVRNWSQRNYPFDWDLVA